MQFTSSIRTFGKLCPKRKMLMRTAATFSAPTIGLRAAVRSVMESVTLADLLAGDLPAEVRALVDDPDAFGRRVERIRQAGACDFRQLEESLRLGDDGIDLFDGDVSRGPR